MGKIFYWMMLLGVTTSCNSHHHQYTGQLKEPNILLKNSAGIVKDSLNKMDTRNFSVSRMTYLLNTSETDKNLTCPNKDSMSNIAQEYNQKCLHLFKEYHKLKDSLHTITNLNYVLHTDKLLLKAKNNKLKIVLFISSTLLIISIIVLFLTNRCKKLKTKYDHLSAITKHTQWGFLVTKEFIAENHIAYDELERMLNRAKGMNNVNTEFYNKFHNALTQQKASYSGRLFNHLTSSNGSFETKFQQQFPGLNTDDLLLATMIHHQWKISDMASILHISLDATRKRKMRLSSKISAYLKKEIDLDEYLTNF